MKIITSGSEDQRKEWITPLSIDAELVWVEDYRDFNLHKDADAFIDLSFRPEPRRIQLLVELLPNLVIINSVEHTLKETNPGFIRMNGWPSFLASPLVEASGPDSLQDSAAQVLALLGKKIQWVPDEPGFVTPRVISMIINEAYFSLEEGVSTKADMDTAMKLGTNYPFGPFEWAEKIDRQNIRNLLLKLSTSHSRYSPSSLL